MENLKTFGEDFGVSSVEPLIRSYGWIWLTRLKRNRQVNPDGTGNHPIADVDIAAAGTVVHLKGYGFGVSSAERYEAKLDIVREAIRAYLASPRFSLNPTA